MTTPHAYGQRWHELRTLHDAVSTLGFTAAVMQRVGGPLAGPAPQVRREADARLLRGEPAVVAYLVEEGRHAYAALGGPGGATESNVLGFLTTTLQHDVAARVMGYPHDDVAALPSVRAAADALKEPVERLVREGMQPEWVAEGVGRTLLEGRWIDHSDVGSPVDANLRYRLGEQLMTWSRRTGWHPTSAPDLYPSATAAMRTWWCAGASVLSVDPVVLAAAAEGRVVSVAEAARSATRVPETGLDGLRAVRRVSHGEVVALPEAAGPRVHDVPRGRAPGLEGRFLQRGATG